MVCRLHPLAWAWRPPRWSRKCAPSPTAPRWSPTPHLFPLMHECKDVPRKDACLLFSCTHTSIQPPQQATQQPLLSGPPQGSDSRIMKKRKAANAPPAPSAPPRLCQWPGCILEPVTPGAKHCGNHNTQGSASYQAKHDQTGVRRVRKRCVAMKHFDLLPHNRSAFVTTPHPPTPSVTRDSRTIASTPPTIYRRLWRYWAVLTSPLLKLLPNPTSPPPTWPWTIFPPALLLCPPLLPPRHPRACPRPSSPGTSGPRRGHRPRAAPHGGHDGHGHGPAHAQAGRGPAHARAGHGPGTSGGHSRQGTHRRRGPDQGHYVVYWGSWPGRTAGNELT